MTVPGVNRALAVLTLLLGGLAAVAGTRPAPDAQAVDALTVAGWIRDRHRVTILDLRDSSAFAAFHLPGARRAVGPIEMLVTDPADTVVLVGDGRGQAARHAVRLRDAGASVRWLNGGVEAWSREVLNPTIAENASDADFAGFGLVAALSRYFGGVPRVVPAGSADTTRGSAARTVRRGCGF